MMERYHEVWRTYTEQGVEAFLEHCTDDLIAEEYADPPGAAVWHGREGLRTPSRAPCASAGRAG